MHPLALPDFLEGKSHKGFVENFILFSVLESTPGSNEQ
jgi:hypothetical protein